MNLDESFSHFFLKGLLIRLTCEIRFFLKIPLALLHMSSNHPRLVRLDLAPLNHLILEMRPSQISAKDGKLSPWIIPKFCRVAILDLPETMILDNILTCQCFQPYGWAAWGIIESNQLLNRPVPSIFDVPELGPRLWCVVYPSPPDFGFLDLKHHFRVSKA